MFYTGCLAGMTRPEQAVFNSDNTNPGTAGYKISVWQIK